LKTFPQQQNWTQNEYISVHAPWLWWIDSLAIPFSGCDPSVIWLEECKLLDPSLDSTWTIWQKYPNSLPETAITMIQQGRKTFSKGYEGWLLDVFYDLDWGQLQDASEFTSQIKNLIETLNYPEGVSLIFWNVWSKKKEMLAPDFDPRQSEWTALEIISQIISLLSSLEEHLKFRDFPIHPANIVIPQSWLNEYDEGTFINGITPWEYWRNHIRDEDNNIQLSSKPYLIHDYRIYPETQDQLIFEPSWMKVRGLGMVLLGLLRKSFKWPAIWNLPDHSPLFHRSVRMLIGEVNCSSLTAGILESCLLPRSRETLLIPLLQADIKMNSDTTYHPPQIANLSDLKSQIDEAQRVLEGYQFSVQANQPRQLVPLRIEQLPRFGDELSQMQEPLND